MSSEIQTLATASTRRGLLKARDRIKSRAMAGYRGIVTSRSSALRSVACSQMTLKAAPVAVAALTLVYAEILPQEENSND